jgi:SAM-dependent methyltransferase
VADGGGDVDGGPAAVRYTTDPAEHGAVGDRAADGIAGPRPADDVEEERRSVDVRIDPGQAEAEPRVRARRAVNAQQKRVLVRRGRSRRARVAVLERRDLRRGGRGRRDNGDSDGCQRREETSAAGAAAHDCSIDRGRPPPQSLERGPPNVQYDPAVAVALARCPGCGERFRPEEAEPAGRCAACGRTLRRDDGVLDLLPAGGATGEQEYYDRYYGDDGPEGEELDPTALRRLWNSLYYPANSLVLDRVGDVRGKTVLLLGNGESPKELWFLTDEPRLLVLSDLSPEAVRTMRTRYRLAEHEPTLVCAAIDAQQLPFDDESIDVVYAYAAVHHLPDVDRFIREAARVLRPGGRAVFHDDGYAPLWHYSKQTWLRPLMRYFHKLEEPSPEDLRFTLSGGFREEQLAAAIRVAGGEPWFFRTEFVHYFFTRASERLPPQRLFKRLAGSDRLLRALIALDNGLSRSRLVRRNLIRLVWGFDKPAATAR